MLDQYTETIVMIYVIFVAFAFVFILGTAAIAKVLYISMQPGQIFGGWQHVLNKLNDANSRFANAIYKPLGGCEFCFAHMLSVIGFALFVCFTYVVLDSWPLHISSLIWVNIIADVAGYLMYVCTSTVIATLVITRL